MVQPQPARPQGVCRVWHKERCHLSELLDSRSAGLWRGPVPAHCFAWLMSWSLDSREGAAPAWWRPAVAAILDAKAVVCLDCTPPGGPPSTRAALIA